MADQRERNQRVCEILRESKGKRVAELYDCATWTLREMNHPQKVSVAAYCLREVMDGLGLRPFDNLQNHLRKLSDAWKEKEAEIAKVINGTCEARENGSVMQFLSECKTVFSELKKRPSVEKEMIAALEKDDPSKAPVPTLLRKGMAKTLKDLRRDATSLLHGKEMSAEEFSKTLDQFEEIVLSVHRPSTFEDQKQIDELIRRVEGNG